MMLGMSFPAFTLVHVIISLITICAGLIVLVAQSFQKLPFLQALAATQSEPPFIVAQNLLLLVFIAIGIAAVRSFHPKTRSLALSQVLILTTLP